MNKLREARFEKRKSQILLFKETGIWPSRISCIENDHLEATRTEKKKLSAALNWEQNLLFPEVDKKKQSQMEGTKKSRRKEDKQRLSDRS